MARVLHLPADREAVRSGFRELIARLERRRRGASLSPRLANSLWGEQARPFPARVHADPRRRLPGRARTPSTSATPPRRPVVAINAWVDGKTNHLIPELLSSGDVRSGHLARPREHGLFQGRAGSTRSPRSATAPADFHLADGSKVSVPMMRRRIACPYAEGDGFGLLELPYKGGDLAFDVVLPNEGVSLDKVESNLGLPELQHAIDRLGERERGAGDAQVQGHGRRRAVGAARGPGHGAGVRRRRPTSAGSTAAASCTSRRSSTRSSSTSTRRGPRPRRPRRRSSPGPWPASRPARLPRRPAVPLPDPRRQDGHNPLPGAGRRPDALSLGCPEGSPGGR